ncbi:hypothetical protein ABFS83_14G095600 [Erythranthe nasuta]
MGNYWKITSSSSRSDEGKIEKKMNTPKGHIVVYVGEEMGRFVIPISFLKIPQFQKLLDESAEVYGFHSPRGGIILPCTKSTFFNVVNFCRCRSGRS